MQRSIKEALAILMRKPVPIVGAGRIGVGVHVRLMIVYFDREELIRDLAFLMEKSNRSLPKNIAVYKIVSVVPEAHVRFDATLRTYKYYVTTKKDLFNHELVCKLPGRLDSEAMNEVCKVLFDYIDFTSFSKLYVDIKTNNCHIQYVDWMQEGDIWVFTIRADRFLRNMVRAIVGTLLEVGRGRLAIDGFQNVIKAKDCCEAGTSVPGHVLFLIDVMCLEELFPMED